MTRKEGATVLADELKRRRLTYEACVQALETYARQEGIDATVSAKHLSRLCLGNKTADTLRLGTRELLERFFDMPVESLLQAPAAAPAAAAAGVVGGEAAAAADLAPLEVDQLVSADGAQLGSGLASLAALDLLEPGRREQLVVVPDAWRDLVVAALVGAETPSPAGSVDPREITRTDIEAVRQATEMFGAFDYQFGGGRSRLLVTQCLTTSAAPKLRHADPASATGREFLDAVAALTRLAAWSAYDTGLHGLAQYYFANAFAAARKAGDLPLAGRVLSGASHQANYLGHYARAAELARTAHRLNTATATQTALSMFKAMEARALSSMGQEAACTAALREAEAHMARSDPSGDPSWIHYFDAAELHAEHAHCFRDLGKPDLAADHAEQSIRAQSSLYVRSTAFCRTVLATAWLHAGDLDQALHVARGVVDTATELQSSRIRSYLHDFRRDLGSRADTPAVREFQDFAAVSLGGESAPVPGRLIIL